MRINRYVATASGVSRRYADKLIAEGKVEVNGKTVTIGQDISDDQIVTLNGKQLQLPESNIAIAFNKPKGFVVSRNGQGSPTIYALLPDKYSNLKPIGRLDKDSQGLLLLSNNGKFIQSQLHPSFNKEKVYEVTLDKDVTEEDLKLLTKGITLNDGLSKLDIKKRKAKHLTVTLSEGRNRQIRRTFAAIGYTVTKLKRISFGKYGLGDLQSGDHIEVKP